MKVKEKAADGKEKKRTEENGMGMKERRGD